MCSKRFRLFQKAILPFLVLCCITIFVLSWALQENKVVTEEIYEVDSAYVSHDIIAYFCMVCDPPSQDQEIIDLTNQYLSEEKVSDFIARAKENAESLATPLSDVWVIFIKPSERLGIGEFPEQGTILSYFPEDHMIRIVRLGSIGEDEGVASPTPVKDGEAVSGQRGGSSVLTE